MILDAFVEECRILDGGVNCAYCTAESAEAKKAFEGTGRILNRYTKEKGRI
jgi:hypothetical protein